MANMSLTIVRIVLVGLVMLPTLTSAQLRDRSRLKPPLLRLPHLGQRVQNHKNAQNANQQHNDTQPRVAAVPTTQPPIAQATPSQPGQPLAPGQVAPAPVVAGQPLAPGQLAPGQVPAPAGTIATTPPLATTTPQPGTPGASFGQPLANVSGLTNPPANAQSVPVATPSKNPAGAVNQVALANKGRMLEDNTPPSASLMEGPTRTMSLALDDAEAALQHMRDNVRDYTCQFVKRERVKGELVATETMAMKVRNRVVQNGKIVVPLSVYMKFLGPRELAGREALFTEGSNNEKLLCKEGGTRGRFLPAMWLNQTSPFVMSTNRYPISEIGMTRLAEKLVKSGRATPVDDCQVKYIQGAKVDGRICSYLQIIRPTPRPGLPVGHNNVNIAEIFIDTELKMPVRFVAYDWPAQAGGKPRLIEQYTYRNINVNVGLNDDDFSRKNPKYKF